MTTRKRALRASDQAELVKEIPHLVQYIAMGMVTAGLVDRKHMHRNSRNVRWMLQEIRQNPALINLQLRKMSNAGRLQQMLPLIRSHIREVKKDRTLMASKTAAASNYNLVTLKHLVKTERIPLKTAMTFAQEIVALEGPKAPRNISRKLKTQVDALGRAVEKEDNASFLRILTRLNESVKRLAA